MPYLDGLPLASSVSSSDIVAVDQGGVPGRAGTATTRQATIAQITAPTAIGGATVPNLATLRGSTSASLPSGLVYVAGYYSGADGGEGPFWLSADTTSADNGGTIIVDASNRRWLRETGGLPNSVKWFGARGDGATDDTATINATVSATAIAGGMVWLPSGVYLLGTTLTLLSNVILEGAGPYATIFRGKPGTSHSLVQTLGFSSLTGTNTPAGPSKFGLRLLGIDGNLNASRGTTGDCLDIYGFDYIIDHVEIYNAPNINFYSEWAIYGGSPPSATPPNDFMEARITDIKTFEARLDGIVFNGPHDSIFTDVLTYANGRVGANFGQSSTYTAGGVMLANFHSYGNGDVGLVIGTEVFASLVESESNLSAGGIETTSTGQLIASNVLAWGNVGFGISFNGEGSQVTGLQTFSNTGDGIATFAAATVLGNVLSHNNTGNGIITNDLDGNLILTGGQFYSNIGAGIVLQSNDCTLSGIFVNANAGGGVSLSNGIGGLMLQGKMTANTGTQLALNAPATGNIIDAVIFTQAGQTAYSGTLGNSFYRLATTGADVRPVSQAQT